MTPSLTPHREISRGLRLGQRSMLTTLAAELKREFGPTVPAFERAVALDLAGVAREFEPRVGDADMAPLLGFRAPHGRARGRDLRAVRVGRPHRGRQWPTDGAS